MVLAFGFCFCVSFVLNQWKSVPPAKSKSIQLGEKGVILSNSFNRNFTSVVLLEGTANPLGPRVTAIPGMPLSYHETTSADFELPPVPFGDDTPWFIKSFSIDIRMNAEMFQRKLTDGFFSYLIYVGSFVILLCAIGYAVKFSVWPLANLFLATLAFRGIFAFSSFFNSPEMQETIKSFLNNKMPVTFALPLLFIAFSFLVHLYSFLVFIAKRKLEND